MSSAYTLSEFSFASESERTLSVFTALVALINDDAVVDLIAALQDNPERPVDDQFDLLGQEFQVVEALRQALVFSPELFQTMEFPIPHLRHMEGNQFGDDECFLTDLASALIAGTYRACDDDSVTIIEFACTGGSVAGGNIYAVDRYGERAIEQHDFVLAETEAQEKGVRHYLANMTTPRVDGYTENFLLELPKTAAESIEQAAMTLLAQVFFEETDGEDLTFDADVEHGLRINCGITDNDVIVHSLELVTPFEAYILARGVETYG